MNDGEAILAKTVYFGVNGADKGGEVVVSLYHRCVTSSISLDVSFAYYTIMLWKQERGQAFRDHVGRDRARHSLCTSSKNPAVNRPQPPLFPPHFRYSNVIYCFRLNATLISYIYCAVDCTNKNSGWIEHVQLCLSLSDSCCILAITSISTQT